MVVKESQGQLHKISTFLAKEKLEVLELSANEPTLEEVFINLTAKDLRD